MCYCTFKWQKIPITYIIVAIVWNNLSWLQDCAEVLWEANAWVLQQMTNLEYEPNNRRFLSFLNMSECVGFIPVRGKLYFIPLEIVTIIGLFLWFPMRTSVKYIFQSEDWFIDLWCAVKSFSTPNDHIYQFFSRYLSVLSGLSIGQPSPL